MHVGRSDNGAARRFERSMSCSQPRHWVKCEAPVSLIIAGLRERRSVLLQTCQIKTATGSERSAAGINSVRCDAQLIGKPVFAQLEE